MSKLPLCMNPLGTFTWPLTNGRVKATFPPSSAVIVTFSSPEFAGFFECTLHPASSGSTRKSIERFMRTSCITAIIQRGSVTGQARLPEPLDRNRRSDGRRCVVSLGNDPDAKDGARPRAPIIFDRGREADIPAVGYGPPDQRTARRVPSHDDRPAPLVTFDVEGQHPLVGQAVFGPEDQSRLRSRFRMAAKGCIGAVNTASGDAGAQREIMQDVDPCTQQTAVLQQE